MHNIFVYGSINTDYVYELSKYPQVGETMEAKKMSIFPGGKGANQAVAASKLGGNVFMIGNVGSDANGISMIQNLKYHDVHTEYIDTVNDVTATAFISIVDSDNAIVIHKGANAYSSVNQFILAINKHAVINDILVVQFEKDIIDIIEAVKIAKSCGFRILINPAPMHVESVIKLLPYSDMWILNETETEQLIKTKVTHLNYKESLLALQKLGMKQAIITLGKDGSITLENDKLIHQESIAPSQVVDTTGAGDTFVGAIVVSQAEDKTLSESLKFASKAAACSVTKLGAQEGMPSRKDIDSI
jgi:ribokinase